MNLTQKLLNSSKKILPKFAGGMSYVDCFIINSTYYYIMVKYKLSILLMIFVIPNSSFSGGIDDEINDQQKVLERRTFESIRDSILRNPIHPIQRQLNESALMINLYNLNNNSLACNSSDSTKKKRDYLIRDAIELRKRSTKANLSKEDQIYLRQWWEKRSGRDRLASLMNIKSEIFSEEMTPEQSNHSSFDLNDLPPLDSLPPLMTLEEGRYGKAQNINEVLHRPNKLYGHGIEVQKGGIANLIDIIISGFCHGYTAPMAQGLDGSLSSLEHGPYWVIVDQEILHSGDPLFTEGADSFVTNKYVLAYLVPDERYEEIVEALKGYKQLGVLSESELTKLTSQIIPYEEYAQIGQGSSQSTPKSLSPKNLYHYKDGDTIENFSMPVINAEMDGDLPFGLLTVDKGLSIQPPITEELLKEHLKQKMSK